MSSSGEGASNAGPAPAITSDPSPPVVPRAVAVDANVMARGKLWLDELRDWAGVLERIEWEVWIPEPVAWEWAEHAVDEYQQAVTTYRSAARKLRLAGFPPPNWSPETDPSVLISEYVNRITAIRNVVVVSVHPDDALRALRDQVLLRPPAERKNARDGKLGVKTGAADIASVAAIRRHAGEARGYVLLSQDGDWPLVYETNGWPVPDVYKSWPELRKQLFTVVGGTGHAPALLRFLLADGLWRAEGVFDTHAGPGGITETEVQSGIETSFRETRIQRLNAVAGLKNIQFVEDTAQLLATAFFLADIEVLRYRVESEFPRIGYATFQDVLVRGNLNFRVRDDVITDPALDGIGEVQVLRPTGYATMDSALTAVVDALRSIPGLDSLNWSDEQGGRAALSMQAGESPATVALQMEHRSDAGWTLRVVVSVEEESVFLISCVYETDARVGGGDGMLLDLPWRLVGANPATGRPEWRIAADVLASLYDR
jgi:hypothetical protein